MKTLNECKDEVAKKHNYHDWSSLEQDCFSVPFIISAMEEAAKLYAESALREAAERAKVEREQMIDWESMPREKQLSSERFYSTRNEFYSIDKDSILSLIKELK